jgi:hypothetical protein
MQIKRRQTPKLSEETLSKYNINKLFLKSSTSMRKIPEPVPEIDLGKPSHRQHAINLQLWFEKMVKLVTS